MHNLPYTMTSAVAHTLQTSHVWRCALRTLMKDCKHALPNKTANKQLTRNDQKKPMLDHLARKKKWLVHLLSWWERVRLPNKY